MFAPEMINEVPWQQYFEMNQGQQQGGGAGAANNDANNSSRLAKGMAAHNMRELPLDFQLGEHDVICGRGRKCFHHIGNQRFRELVMDMLEKYSDSPSKLDKSYIICDVVNTIRKRSPNGGFVKFDAQNGRYYEVGDFLAREKTSQAFRDALHDQYKSSNSQKKKRRWVDNERFFERQNSAPLLCVSSIRESLEEDVVGGSRSGDMYQEEHDASLSSLQFQQYDSSEIRSIRPELMNKLCKQRSAPSLFHSYAEKFHNSSGHITPETAHSLSGSSRSLYAPSESSEDSFKNHMEETKTLVSVSNKRRAFARQHKSMRSVVEEVEEIPEWINRSCPNLRQTLHELNNGNGNGSPNSGGFSSANRTSNMKRDGFIPYTIEHSQHDSYLSGRPNMIIEETAEQYADSPVKPTNQILSIRNHEEFVLSPIGDGSVDGLFEVLNKMDLDEANTKGGDMFEPLPF